jgi:uridine phosphorylase
MELATLLIVAALRGVRAGGAFTVDGNPAEAEKSIYDYNPHRQVVDEGKQRMVTVGLDAAVRLARQEAAEAGRGGPS